MRGPNDRTGLCGLSTELFLRARDCCPINKAAAIHTHHEERWWPFKLSLSVLWLWAQPQSPIPTNCSEKISCQLDTRAADQPRVAMDINGSLVLRVTAEAGRQPGQGVQARTWHRPGTPTSSKGQGHPNCLSSDLKTGSSSHGLLTIYTCQVTSVVTRWLFGTPGTIAPQAPLSMGFSRQEHWSAMLLGIK